MRRRDFVFDACSRLWLASLSFGSAEVPLLAEAATGWLREVIEVVAGSEVRLFILDRLADVLLERDSWASSSRERFWLRRSWLRFAVGVDWSTDTSVW